MKKPDFEKRGTELINQPQKPYSPPTVRIVQNRFSEFSQLKEILSMEFPEGKWLIDNLISYQGISIVSGTPGSYKTWLLLLMAKCISEGTSFLGKFSTLKQNVLIIDEENHKRLHKQRFSLLGATDESNIHILSLQGFSILNEAWVNKVLDYCEKFDIEVIFIDSLVRVHGKEENSSKDMSEVFGKFKILCGKGKSIVLTHHERKEGVSRTSAKNSLRGSSDILASLDSLVSVRRNPLDKNSVLIENAKSRESVELETFQVSVISDEESVYFQYVGEHSKKEEKSDRVGEAITTLLKEREEAPTMTEIVDQVAEDSGIGKRSIKTVLLEMTELGEIFIKKGSKNTKLCFLADIPKDVKDSTPLEE